MRTNVAVSGTRRVYTHEGAPASANVSAIDQLRRAVMACLLFEDTFYESGVAIADRIAALVGQCDDRAVADLAIEARTKGFIRHASLLMVRALIEKQSPEAERAVAGVLQRADEPAELLAMMFKAGRTPVPHAVRRGVETALRRFDAYQLSKWKGDRNAVKLRDVFRLCHPRPADDAQRALWGSVVDGSISPPETWEVRLSAAGSDPEAKRAVWQSLLSENRLGGLGLLRNLRNMVDAGVPIDAIAQAVESNPFRRVLPFRFLAALTHAPRLGSELEAAMFRALADMPKLPGETVLLVDVSGSMNDPLSSKSDLTRLEAAAALAILAREVCETARVFWFSDGSNGLYQMTGAFSMGRYSPSDLPPSQHWFGEFSSAYRGLGLRDAILATPRGGTDLGGAIAKVPATDRLIVFTDEQSRTAVGSRPDIPRRYIVNVAANQHGVGYGDWTKIDGFSENVLRYIESLESGEIDFQA